MKDLVRRRFATADDDSGSALILALLVVLVGSLLIGASLDFARAGLTIAPKTRELRNETAYLQGAVDGASNSIRSSTAYGRTTGPACPSYTAPNAAALDGLQGATGKTFTVSCTPKTVTGASAADQPDFAIQALGTATNEGINQVGGNHTLVIDGGIYSRGKVAGGTLPDAGIEVNGSVFAEDACSEVTTTDITGLHCNYPGPSGIDTFGSDPNYLASIADDSDLGALIGPDTSAQADLGADPVPTCTSSASEIVKFEPGYYSATPEDLVSSLTTCSGHTYHFKPGRYYLNYDGTWNPSPSKQLKLLGGTLASTYAAGDPLGGACDPAQPGVQFVLGGATQLIVNNKSQLELCGPTASQAFTGAPQRIVLYGLSGNPDNNARVGAPPDVTQDRKVSATPTTGAGSAAFSNPDRAQTIDTVGLATYSPLAKNKTGTLHFPSFEHLPKGARVSTVVLQVQQTLVDADSSAVITRTGQPDLAINEIPSCPTGCELDITSTFAGSGPEWRSINSMALDYSVKTTTATGSAAVDGLALTVTYTVPALEQLSCAGAGCKLFDSSGNDAVFFHGTVYTPSAAWAVDIHNSSGNIFDRGIVVRTIDIIVSASSKQTTSPFQLPAATPQGRLVLFRGYVDGVEALRACATYKDRAGSGDTALASAGYQVGIRHWSVFTPSVAENPSCA